MSPGVAVVVSCLVTEATDTPAHTTSTKLIKSNLTVPHTFNGLSCIHGNCRFKPFHFLNDGFKLGTAGQAPEDTCMVKLYYGSCVGAVELASSIVSSYREDTWGTWQWK